MCFFAYSRQKDLSFPLRWDDSTHFHPERQTWSGRIEISQRIHFTLQDLYWFIKLRILLKLKYFACARGPSTTSARLISGEKIQNFYQTWFTRFSGCAHTFSTLEFRGAFPRLWKWQTQQRKWSMKLLPCCLHRCLKIYIQSSAIGLPRSKTGNETSQWPINDLKFCSN